MVAQRRVTLADRLRDTYNQRHSLEAEATESIKAKERNALDTKCLIAFWLFFIGCGTTVILAEKIKPPVQVAQTSLSSSPEVIFNCNKSNGCLGIVPQSDTGMWFDPNYDNSLYEYQRMYQLRPYGKFWEERDLMGRNL